MVKSLRGNHTAYGGEVVVVIAVALLFSSLAAAVFMPQNASAQVQAANERFNGSGASASWYSEDNGVYTDAYVFTTDSAYREKSNSYDQSWAYVSIYKYKIGEVCYPDYYYGGDYCYYGYVPIEGFNGYTDIAADSFKLQADKGAALNTTITGYDYINGTSKTITVAVNWSTTEQPSHGSSSYRYNTENYMYNEHSVGSNASANATASISGDITMDFGTTQWGYIYKSNSGYVSIVKY